VRPPRARPGMPGNAKVVGLRPETLHRTLLGFLPRRVDDVLGHCRQMTRSGPSYDLATCELIVEELRADGGKTKRPARLGSGPRGKCGSRWVTLRSNVCVRIRNRQDVFLFHGRADRRCGPPRCRAERQSRQRGAKPGCLPKAPKNRNLASGRLVHGRLDGPAEPGWLDRPPLHLIPFPASNLRGLVVTQRSYHSPASAVFCREFNVQKCRARKTWDVTRSVMRLVAKKTPNPRGRVCSRDEWGAQAPNHRPTAPEASHLPMTARRHRAGSPPKMRVKRATQEPCRVHDDQETKK